MNYIVNLIKNQKKRTNIPMIPKYITIHSTANTATAQNECEYLHSKFNVSEVGWHLVVDDTNAIECIPLNEVAWHAGDGLNGIGNRQSISIEICEGGDREKTLKNAIELTAKIARQNNIPIYNVVQHNFWSNKNCPRILRDSGRWGWFIEEVKKQLYMSNIHLDNLISRGIIQNRDVWQNGDEPVSKANVLALIDKAIAKLEGK